MFLSVLSRCIGEYWDSQFENKKFSSGLIRNIEEKWSGVIRKSPLIKSSEDMFEHQSLMKRIAAILLLLYYLQISSRTDSSSGLRCDREQIRIFPHSREWYTVSYTLVKLFINSRIFIWLKWLCKLAKRRVSFSFSWIPHWRVTLTGGRARMSPWSSKLKDRWSCKAKTTDLFRSTSD